MKLSRKLRLFCIFPKSLDCTASCSYPCQPPPQQRVPRLGDRTMECERSMECMNYHLRVFEEGTEASSTAMAQSISESGSWKLSSAQPGKIEMHALGGVCAGEARLHELLRASQMNQLGHNEVFDDVPVTGDRKQVVMAAHCLRSTFWCECQRTRLKMLPYLAHYLVCQEGQDPWTRLRVRGRGTAHGLASRFIRLTSTPNSQLPTPNPQPELSSLLPTLHRFSSTGAHTYQSTIL